MWAYLGLGLSMGLGAGISPGPLLALVITASLRSGMAGGLRVAFAPLLTDLPIVLLSVFLVGQLSPEVLRWVGTVGGLVALWMGTETLRSLRKGSQSLGELAKTAPQRELWRGVVVNSLNPHPYLFWATVGGPAVVRGWRSSPWHVLAFILPFYTLLVGSKILVAWLVSQRASALSQTWYRRMLVGCGILMLAMGGWLIWQSWAG